MKKKEFAVGEEFQIGDVKLEVVKAPTNEYGDSYCTGCYFLHPNPHCRTFREQIGNCARTKRADKTPVIFKKVDDPEQSSESKKNDFIDNKVRMDLLPWPELEEIGKVYTAGAKKYGPNQWQDLSDGYQRYKGAMLRHLIELEKGNDVDSDTGCLHAAQIAWNAIAMLHFKLQEYKSKRE